MPGSVPSFSLIVYLYSPASVYLIGSNNISPLVDIVFFCNTFPFPSFNSNSNGLVAWSFPVKDLLTCKTASPSNALYSLVKVVLPSYSTVATSFPDPSSVTFTVTFTS